MSVFFSDPLPNLKENQIISPVSGSGSGLFDRSISFGTSSESENENKDKINENGEEEVDQFCIVTPSTHNQSCFTPTTIAPPPFPSCLPFFCFLPQQYFIFFKLWLVE
jgi:hypothetical protein